MAQTGVKAFDTTIHKTDVWLNEVGSALGSGNRHTAYLALRAVLHTLRDRLLPVEATQLGAQLPMLIRGFYYDGFDPTRTPVKQRSKAEFLEKVRSHFQTTTQPPDLDPEQVCRAVFQVLSNHVTPGEIGDVIDELPRDLKALWPAPGTELGGNGARP